MTLLSININKFALIRNSRGTDTPNLIDIATKCIRYGAQGITIHPRPDERHATRADVPELKKCCDELDVEFNVEGYPSSEFLDLVCQVKPTQVTLVPDPPDALTSSFGWNLKENQAFLTDVVSQLHEAGIRSSLFIDPDVTDIPLLNEIKTDRVELYTFDYAHHFPINPEAAIAPYKNCVKQLSELNITLNAGHDLNLDNVRFFLNQLNCIDEVSIGHALVCDAFDFGLEDTVKKYREQVSITA